MLTIITLIKKYWKYILAFLSFPILLSFFKSSGNTSNTNKSAKEDFKDWWVKNIVGKGYVTSKTSDKLFNNAKLLSIYLGTFIGEPQNTEDEEKVVQLMFQHRFADYICLEYAYNRYFTKNRDLTADLHSYLSSSQYDEVSPIIFDNSYNGQSNLVSYTPDFSPPRPKGNSIVADNWTNENAQHY